MTRAEQETVVRWDEAEQIVHIWSASRVTWRKMARLGVAPSKETTEADGTPSGKWFQVPFSRFRWGLKRRGRSQGTPAAFLRARPVNKRAPDAPSGSEGQGATP
jgi:hypothetical protein